MTREQRLEYVVKSEIDVYINMLQEHMIKDRETRNFVCRTVLPRFNKLRAALMGLTEEEYLKQDEEEDCEI
jgi:hypothetical protein